MSPEFQRNGRLLVLSHRLFFFHRDSRTRGGVDVAIDLFPIACQLPAMQMADDDEEEPVRGGKVAPNVGAKRRMQELVTADLVLTIPDLHEIGNRLIRCLKFLIQVDKRHDSKRSVGSSMPLS